MRLLALLLGLAAAGLWLGWLAVGRAPGKTKRIAFRATLLADIALLDLRGPEILARRHLS